MLIKMRWFAMFTLLTIFSVPALADVRASYMQVDNASQRLIVEVTDDGAMRISSVSGGLSDYFLFLEGEAYIVNAGPGGPDVSTLDAAAEIARRGRQNAITIGGGSEGQDVTSSIQYAPTGAVTIAGHDGVRYDFPDTWNPIFTQMVLSEEPALLPLGKALITYDQATSRLAYFRETRDDNVAELLSEHGVLAIWQYELTSVSFDTIDSARFAIPAPPLTLAELEEVAPEAELVNNPEASIGQPFVIGAEFHQHTLYTLLSDGRLQAWPEGAETGMDVDVPTFAIDFCVIGDDLFLLTVDQEDWNMRLWVRTSDTWSIKTAFTENGNSPFVILDCSTTQPVLRSNNMIRYPFVSRPTDDETLLYYSSMGSQTVLLHGGFMYVGSNAGEFGGGLQRFPIGGGAGKIISQTDPDVSCGGILNPQCDPVTGLVADPLNPDCILATIGLVHFFSTGAVVRVCGDSLSLAYEKPYTLDPDWHFDPENSGNAFPSVAFYSVGGNADSAWAVASDGIYKFGANAIPEFFPFPRNFRMPESGIDWSHPEYILVQTTMNQRFSVSGASLILVPR